MKKNTTPLTPAHHNSASTEAEDAAHRGYREERAHMMRSNAAENKRAAAQELESKPSMDINESAEAFIKNFRQQLLIQRLESIENFEQMLARGL